MDDIIWCMEYAQRSENATGTFSEIAQLCNTALHELAQQLFSLETGVPSWMKITGIFAASIGFYECISLYAQKDYLLYKAAENHEILAMRLLLALGADPTVNVPTYNESVMHYVSRKGELQMLSLFLSKEFSIHGKDALDRTPLHCAGYCDDKKKGKLCAQLLLQNGANPHAADNSKQTPLHTATSGQSHDIVKLLIEKKGNVNEQDENGKTPLHIAAALEYCPIIETLLWHNARPDIKTNLDKTAYQIAIDRNKDEAASILVDRNAQRKVIIDKRNPNMKKVYATHKNLFELVSYRQIGYKVKRNKEEKVKK